MKVSEIKESFDGYIDIYKNQLRNLDNKAETLLLNSLYLSVFTIFETFLKSLINHYIECATETGITFSDLKGEIAKDYFLNPSNTKNLKKLLDYPYMTHYTKVHEGLFKEISKDELSNYLKYEFPSEKKLKNHYQVIFDQILGDSDFLKNFILTREDDILGLERREQYSAFSFISKAADRRNRIAHESYKYLVEEFDEDIEFEKYVSDFRMIIEKICDTYEKNTGFSLDSHTSENILNDLKF